MRSSGALTFAKPRMARSRFAPTAHWRWLTLCGVVMVAVALPVKAQEARVRASDPPLQALGRWRKGQRVFAIAQDHRGYLLFGTDAGLARFDGVEFRGVDLGASAGRGQEVRALATTAQGVTWLGLGGGGGLVRLDARGGRAVIAGAQLGGGGVNDLVVARDGQVWVASKTGVFRVNGSAVAQVPSATTAQAAPAFALAEDREGRIWMAGAAGLFVVSGGALRALGPAVPSYDLAVAPDGRVWVAHAEGLSRVEEDGSVSQMPPLGRAGPVRRLLFDREGKLWAATRTGLEGPGGVTLPIRGGEVLALAQDREGGLWVGTNIGDVLQFGDRLVHTIAVPTAAAAQVAFAVLPESAAVTWATVPRGLVRVENGQSTLFANGEQYPGHCPRALTQDARGDLYVGDCSGGLVRLREGQFEVFGRAHGLSDERLQSVLASRDGGVYAGLRVGGLVHFDGERFRPIPYPVTACPAQGPGGDAFERSGTQFDLCPSVVVAMAEHKAGGLWLGTRLEGVYLVSAAGLSRVGVDQGLPTNKILSLHEDDDGALWIGTAGGGLARWRPPGEVDVMATADGLPADEISAIVEDRAGELWLGSDHGVARVKKVDLDAFFAGRTNRVRFYAYGRDDGMDEERCSRNWGPIAQRGPDGQLWFATTGGLAVFSGAGREAAQPPPDVVIEEVLLGGNRMRHGQGEALELPAGGGALDIRFTAPVFRAPHRVRFRYRLDGYDARWMDAGTTRLAHYDRVRPGTYSFQVRAYRDDLPWAAAEASLPLSVVAFYQRPVFLVAVLVAVGALGLLVQQLRLRYLRVQFTAVIDERNRIARDLHDSLAQYFTGIGYQLERIATKLDSAPDEARKILASAKQMVSHGRMEARHTIWNLRNKDLSTKPLSQALRGLLEQMPFGATMEVAVAVSGREVPIAEDAQDQLLHIVREASINAASHGRAAHVGIDLVFSREHLVLRVSDDGSGFDLDDTAGPMHFGLVGMRERAERLSASFKVESQPGQGTAITVELPLGRATLRAAGTTAAIDEWSKDENS